MKQLQVSLISLVLTALVAFSGCEAGLTSGNDSADGSGEHFSFSDMYNTIDTLKSEIEILKSGITMAVPAGSVISFAGGTVPAGWLLCDGRAVNREEYKGLFAAVSTMYGPGDSSSTFNLPDYRGYFLRGWDNGSGNDPDAAGRTNRGDGTTGNAVGTVQDFAVKDHEHYYSSLTSNDGDHTHPWKFDANHSYAEFLADHYHFSINKGLKGHDQQSYANPAEANIFSIGAAGEHNHSISGNTDGYGESTFETRPKNKSVMYIIKY
ncbi:MAG: tail fiber protein [bacterium]|nr:tail fiber protein [bacterium]